MVWLFAVAFDRTVRKHKCSALAPQYLRLNIRKKELSSLLLVSKLSDSVQVIPGDLKRVFDKNGKWFGHKTENTAQGLSFLSAHSVERTLPEQAF
jgi:hypothetical protein